MDKKTLVIFIFTLIALLSVGGALAQEQQDPEVTVYFFWGEGCPHCAKEKPFLEELDEEYPELEVRMFETYEHSENVKLFREAADVHGIEARGVPTTFIGEEHWVGYSEETGEKIETHIQECIDEGCEDPLADVGLGGEVSEEIENDEENDSDLCAHLFVKDGCPQCESIKDYVNETEQDHDIDINVYEISSGQDKQIYQAFKDKYSLETASYPVVFIGDKYFVGESSIRDNIVDEIEYCQENSCSCPLEKIEGTTPYLPSSGDVTSEKQEIISLPLVGEVNLSLMPTYVTTSIIAFIDGFNPCSLWLITFLLGIVIYSNSRKKILTVGGTFLLVTGTAYALFMAGLLNVFLYVGYMSIIQIVVAILAFIFALVNIKDYFWYKKGISFTIPDKYKPKIFRNMREVMKSNKSLTATVIGTAILALGVVLVELPCTAGFPLIWTNMMAQQGIQGFAFFMHLLLYMVIYLSIEIVIIIAALVTMKSAKFEEKHGRILKLIGGMIMLALGFVMLINPDLMNSIGNTLMIFGGAIVASFLLIFIHRKLLPKFGIKIGSEKLEDDKNDR
ncbi:MAG: glutaredoxin domain-containing protein [Nanobdellota archaeon]